jgi:hypothetical protein
MTFLYKKIIKFFVFIILILAAYVGLIYKFPNLNFLEKKPIAIKDTGLIVQETKKIAQLFSCKFYSEIAIDSAKYSYTNKTDYKESIISLANLSKKVFDKKADAKESIKSYSTTKYKDSTLSAKIVLIASGSCYAGNDLDKLKIISSNKDSISVSIPHAKILNTIVNPSDFIIFYDDGNWTNDDVVAVKKRAREKIKTFALNNNIIEKANEKTLKLLTNFLQSLGYESVKVEFTNN